MRIVKSLAFVLAVTALSLVPASEARAAWGDSVISNQAGPWPIVIRTCSEFAGAICSLTWRNKEFVDITDHGRQIQSSANFYFPPNSDPGLDLPETYNPNEAGSRADGSGSTSSSVLEGIWTAGNVLATQTRMAFWLAPGEFGSEGDLAVNTTVLSNYVMNKLVTIGIPGMAHVIEYRTQYHIPPNEHPIRGTFENVTGYMPPEFSRLYSYDVTTGTLANLAITEQEQSLPVIIATPDGGWAMGIYTPASVQAYNRQANYSGYRFGGIVSKWNSVFRVNHNFSTAGHPTHDEFNFRSYVIVGSLENVRVSMDQLYATFQ